MSAVNICQYFSFVPRTLSEAKQNGRDGACRTRQNRRFKPKAACHLSASVLLLKAGWLLCTQAPAFHSGPFPSQKLPDKLFHTLCSSLLSVSNFTCPNGRDHPVKFCLCSNAPRIRPHRRDAAAGKSPLRVSKPAAYTGP